MKDRKAHLEEARRLLRRLQNGEMSLFDSFMKKLEEHKLSLAEVGFTKVIFGGLWRRHCRTIAEQLLNQLRQNEDDAGFTETCEDLFQTLADDKLSLNDFDTRHVNLAKVRAVWIKKAKEAAELACESLKRLREGVSGYDKFLGYIGRGEKIGYYSLDQIGTSAEELQKLRIACCKKRARDLFKRLRSPIGRKREICACLEAELLKCELPPTAIGTNWKELTSLVSKPISKL